MQGTLLFQIGTDKRHSPDFQRNVCSRLLSHDSTSLCLGVAILETAILNMFRTIPSIGWQDQAGPEVHHNRKPASSTAYAEADIFDNIVLSHYPVTGWLPFLQPIIIIWSQATLWLSISFVSQSAHILKYLFVFIYVMVTDQTTFFLVLSCC